MRHIYGPCSHLQFNQDKMYKRRGMFIVSIKLVYVKGSLLVLEYKARQNILSAFWVNIQQFKCVLDGMTWTYSLCELIECSTFLRIETSQLTSFTEVLCNVRIQQLNNLMLSSFQP